MKYSVYVICIADESTKKVTGAYFGMSRPGNLETRIKKHSECLNLGMNPLAQAVNRQGVSAFFFIMTHPSSLTTTRIWETRLIHTARKQADFEVFNKQIGHGCPTAEIPSPLAVKTHRAKGVEDSDCLAEVTNRLEAMGLTRTQSALLSV